MVRSKKQVTQPTPPLKFVGTVTIQTPRRKLWSFLIDPVGLSDCVPGLGQLDILEPGRRFSGQIAYPLGNRQLNLPAVVEWLDLVAENSGRLQAQTTLSGQLIQAESQVRLAGPSGGPTELHWAANVMVPFTKNEQQLLRPLVKNLAQKLITSFLTCVKSRLEQPPPA